MASIIETVIPTKNQGKPEDELAKPKKDLKELLNSNRDLYLKILVAVGCVSSIVTIICCFPTDIRTFYPKPLKTPTIVWYTEVDIRNGYGSVPWLPKQPTINCSSDVCDVFAMSSYNETPDAYIFYGAFMQDFPPRNDNSIWAFVNRESPVNATNFFNENTLRLFNVSSTFSRFSDVPMPLNWLKSFDLLTYTEFVYNTTMKNSFSNEIAPILYLQSECSSFTSRDTYVSSLMELIPVDSYGKCLNNRNFTEDMEHYASEPSDNMAHLYGDDILTFIAKYKFIIAIEDGVCSDHVSTQLWRALSVGTVPIYFGDPKIRDWLPNNKSALLLEDYPTPQILVDQIRELLQNDTKYEEYLDHKLKGRITNKHLLREIEERPYQTNFLETMDELYCKICHAIYRRNDTKEVSIVTKDHYDCAPPMPALALSVKPESYFSSDFSKKEFAAKIYFYFD